MIKIVTGPLGMGKTLFCVTEIFDLLCKGRTVATNVELNWPELCDLAARMRGLVLQRSQWLTIDPGKTPDWHLEIPWGVPGAPVAVYLDEIHLFFNARDWAETAKLRKGMLSFLTQSRKACVDVTFIAQESTTVEKQFRVLCEFEYAVISTEHMPLGILGRLPFRAFVVRVRNVEKGHLIRRLWRSYDRRFWRCYSSFSMLDADMQALASRTQRVHPMALARVSPFRRFWLSLRAFLRLLPFVGKFIPSPQCASS